MGTSNIRDILTAFSPSLDYCAISSGDGRIKIWDTLKGQIQTEFADIVSNEAKNIHSKAETGHLLIDYRCMKWLSFDKKKKRKLRSSLLVLGTGSGDVLALDVSAGQLKWRISDCHPWGVSAIAFATNGSCIYSAGADGMVCEIDSLTGNMLGKFKASTKSISCLAVSSDGKMLVTAAAQLKTFDCSNHKKIQKFTGHPVSVRCMIFTEDGKFILSSAVGERYVAVWRTDGGKKQSASCVLAMEHPAVFIDSKCANNGDIYIFAISETGGCYFWYGQDVEKLRNAKPTKLSLSLEDGLSKTHKGTLPAIFAAKLQSIAKPSSLHAFLAHGLLVKPSFQKIVVQYGRDILLSSFHDEVLLLRSESLKKSLKGLNAQNKASTSDDDDDDGDGDGDDDVPIPEGMEFDMYHRTKVKLIGPDKNGHYDFQKHSFYARRIGKILLRRIDVTGYQWGKVSQATKDFYWGEFMEHFWDESMDQMVKVAFLKTAAKLYRNKVGRWRQQRTKPDCLTKKAWASFREYWASEAFRDKSEKASKNRRSTKGAGLSCHTGGSISFLEHADHLASRYGRPSSSFELFRYTRTSKDDKINGWINDKSRAIREGFIESYASAQAATQQTQEEGGDESAASVDPNKIFLQVAGGVDKRQRVYGLGSQASSYYNLSRASTSSSGMTAQVSTQATQQIEHLQTKLAQTKSKLSQHEQTQQQMQMQIQILTSMVHQIQQPHQPQQQHPHSQMFFEAMHIRQTGGRPPSYLQTGFIPPLYPPPLHPPPLHPHTGGPPLYPPAYPHAYGRPPAHP